jgi:2'-phosphotransferase
MLTKKQIQIGKQLCFILRHDIINSGLTCDSNGYVKVNDLIIKNIISTTIDEIKLIVENNDKKRFLIVQINNEYYIKANQGHSLSVGNLIDDGTALELLTEPLLYCAHGTEEKYIESIYKTGLNRGLRKHIHLVSEINKEKQTSGFKNKSDRIILIDMKECMKVGIVFYKSANDVILTEGIDGIIDSKYFIN